MSAGALPALPARFGATREALHRVACYVLGPARKTRTGRIGLVPVGGGFGTPPLPDGRALVVVGDRLGWRPGDDTPLTTLRAAAAFADVDLSADPGVGRDLPPCRPDEPLSVDAEAAGALGRWYALGATVLDALARELDGTAVGPAQLWPEHFDLAAVVDVGGAKANVGFSPGDGFDAEPYAYVGPHDASTLQGPFWNAPFGAALRYDAIREGDDPASTVLRFVRDGLSASHEP